MHKILSICLLCTAACIGILTWYGTHGVQQLRALENEEKAVSTKNRKLRSGIVGVKNKLYAVQSDSHSLEKKVRTELGMARPGEVIYVMPEESAPTR